jgi:Zn-dependent protease
VLRFQLGRIPVSVHFSFLLLLYIAYQMTRDVAEAAIAGIGIFAGVLLHESGHALTARRFGAVDVSITLFALGGVTTYKPPADISAGRRFLIAASGSALAISGALPVYLAVRADLITNDTLRLIAVGFVFAALVWGLLNWVPIRPLDGGQMMTSALQIFFPQQGASIAKVVSAIFTGGAAIWLVNTGQGLLAMYVVLIGFIGLRNDPGTQARVERPESQPQPYPQRQPEVEDDPPPAFPL